MLDIPKGKIDEGELPIDAAIRETYEETGLHLHQNQLKDLGRFEYNKMKDLHLFSCNIDFNIDSMHCISVFELYGNQVPEMVGYKKVDKTNYYEIGMFFYPSLSKILIPLLKGNLL